MAFDIPQYKRMVERIPKQDLYVCLSLWMEESPLTCVQLDDVDEVIEDEQTVKLNGKRDEDEQTVNLNGKRDEEEEISIVTKKPKVEHEEPDSPTPDVDLSKLESHVEQEMNDNNETLDADDNNDINNVIVNETDLTQEATNSCWTPGGGSKVNKVGVVVVDSDEQIVAMDCSRDSLHAVANALISNPDKVRGAVVYVSRKPCSFCTKLMAQMQISRVFYLPLEPEIPDTEELDKVERIYRVCSIAQSVFIPHISDNVIQRSSSQRSPFTSHKVNHKDFTQQFIVKYWSKDWVNKICQVLLWPEFEELQDEVSRCMEVMFDWIAMVTMVDVPSSTKFIACRTSKHQLSNSVALMRTGTHVCCDSGELVKGNAVAFCPNTVDPKWQALALHMTRMTQILSQRSDDPSRGVGVVILKENEIVAAGWSGYPSKTKYGDFPRAADKDEHFKAKKYPFSIHGEQNVILNRFVQNIKHYSTTMFVNKMPCDECVPMLLKVGIKNVVFPPENEKQHIVQLKYTLVKKSIANGKLKGFVSENVDQKAVQYSHCNGIIKNCIS